MGGNEGHGAPDHAPIISFYYPPGVDDESVPESAGVFHDRPGKYVWTVKTYGYLSRLDFPCRLVRQLPEQGIVVSHREFFKNSMVPNRGQLFVCIQADYWRHPFAQLHLVQNRSDPMLARPSPAWPASFVPLWPEAGLMPRDPARGATFSNVSYFGLPARLAAQLRSAQFAARLREHGFNFRMVDRGRWNDYSDTDAVLAVRSFANVSYHKYPPSKLYNSWIAGVPALLGPESAYRAERRSEYDYFEVHDTEEVLATLIRLRDDPQLRAAVARNCAARAVQVGPFIAEAWSAFLSGVAVPSYRQWCCRSAASRGVFLAARVCRYSVFLCSDFCVRAVSLIRRRLRELRP